MLRKIKYFGGADKIKQHGGKWERDQEKLITLLKATEDNIKETNLLLEEAGLTSKIEFIDATPDNLENKIIPWIAVNNQSRHVLYAFTWDAQTPFFSGDVDKSVPKLDGIKKTLAIENSESQRCENARSSKAYSPNKKQLPFCNEADLFEPGQYVHMNNRPKKAHIGLIVSKPHHEKPIDCNPLAQWSIENYMGELTRDKVRKSEKMVKMLTHDTIYQRLQAFKQGFTDMVFKTMSYPLDAGGSEYTDIFIFLNPIMSADEHYIDALKQLAIERCQFILSKNLYFEANLQTPKFTIILLNSTDGYVCSEYFSPSKITASTTKDLVI